MIILIIIHVISSIMSYITLLLPASVNNTYLLCEPLPCNPATETAPQPLLWRSESFFPDLYSSPEEVCISLSLSLYIYIYIYMHVYVYVHIHI